MRKPRCCGRHVTFILLLAVVLWNAFRARKLVDPRVFGNLACAAFLSLLSFTYFVDRAPVMGLIRALFALLAFGLALTAARTVPP